MSETIKFIKQRNSYRLICKFSPPSSCVISWPGFKKSSARSYWHILDLLWMGHCVLPSWTFVKCAIEYLTWVYVEWIEIKLICKFQKIFGCLIDRFSNWCWFDDALSHSASKIPSFETSKNSSYECTSPCCERCIHQISFKTHLYTRLSDFRQTQFKQLDDVVNRLDEFRSLIAELVRSACR